MADRTEPQPENEKDLPGELRKDLRAVEALQRYSGTSNRPAAHARVVSPGEEQLDVPDESSPYNPTDFLGLNAEIESLLNLPPESPSGASHVRATAVDGENWLLEEEQNPATAPTPASESESTDEESEFSRDSFSESSFVEPEGTTEKTRRVAVPVLAVAAAAAAVFAAFKLTTENVPVVDRLREVVGWKTDSTENTRDPRDETPEERWELKPDGTRVAAPVGSTPPAPEPEPVSGPEPVREPEVASVEEPVPEPEPSEELVSEAPVELPPVEEPLPEEPRYGRDELVARLTAESDASNPFRMQVFGPAMPFPWPATLASALYHGRWHRFAEERIAAETGSTGLESSSVADTGAPFDEAIPFGAPGVSFTLSADAFARWMLLGPEEASALAEFTSPEDFAALAAQIASGPRDDPAGESEANAHVGYSTLRRARGLTPDHWWGEEVPQHLIAGPRETFTPVVGRVRVTMEGGEVFVGRLAWVGRRMICLEAEPGTVALLGREVGNIERLMEPTKPKTLAPSNDLSGLPEVRVTVVGGHLTGRLLEQEGDSVTLLTNEGGRITVESTKVEPIRGEHSLALISGRVSD